MVLAQKGGVVPHWDMELGPISCHAWNKDRTQLAIASGSEVFVLQQQSGTWSVSQILRDHELDVTGLDWAPNTNRIVSCSEDTNAYVYTFEDGVWKPNMVVVRSNRAATCIKWSPQENKLAIGTGAKLVSICNYDKENDWWISKQIKRPFRSTISSIAWHPNNVLVAVGSFDFTTRVFSAYIKDLDKAPDPNPWGTKMPFGQDLAEYKAGGWVHDVAFSPSGCRLAWVAHDSTVSVVDKTDRESQGPVVYNTTCLPYTSLMWANEKDIVVAGFDCQPTLLTFDGKAIKSVMKLDVPPDEKQPNVNSAFKMFRNLSRTASDSVDGGAQLKTLHQNNISDLKMYYGKADMAAKFSTSGLDGIIGIWDIQRRTAATNGTSMSP